MTPHPYVGLAGTIRNPPYVGDRAGVNDHHGIVVAVGQVGSTHEESCAYPGVILLNDDGTTSDGELSCFVPDNPTEARRRLTGATREWSGPDRWQHWIAESAYHPDDYAPPAPGDYTPVGPWECPCLPFIATNGAYNRDWRRPLRRVQG